VTTTVDRDLPAIPSVQSVEDPVAADILLAIKTILDARGSVGPKQWLDENRLQGINGVLATILTNGRDGGDSQLNFSTPPAPENLTTDSTFTNIYLRWNHIPYSNHAYTEIWRAEVDNLGDAVLISTAWGNIYPDPVDNGTKYYYWIRFVSKANIAGTYNSASGTLGETLERPSRIIDGLTGEITESHLFEALQQDIDTLRNEIIIKVNENGYVAGIGIAVVDNDSGNPTGQVVILADKFAIVTPNNDPNEAPKIPFVVGRINGNLTVGINGQLVVDGTIVGRSIAAETITADHLTVGQLSAISGDMGDLTAGTMRTGTSGIRVEISDQGPFRIWMGEGTKTTDNALFYLDEDGNAIFRGILAAAGGVFTGRLDGVDGIFTGTIYAEKIVGDVIDRLVFNERRVGSKLVYQFIYVNVTTTVIVSGINGTSVGSGFGIGMGDIPFTVEYGKKLSSTIPVNSNILAYTLHIDAGNFVRTLVASHFNCAIVPHGVGGEYNTDYTITVKVNGSTVFSERISGSVRHALDNYIIGIRDIAITITPDIEATVQYYVKIHSLAYPAALYRTPGSKKIDLFKSSSEGITYIS